MKLLIDLAEDTYNYMISRCKYQNKDDSGLSEFEKAGIAIKNGTPLPKGHGRLIDADSIYQIVRPIEQSDAEWGMTAETAIRLIYDAFNKAPTIIEADKE